MPIIKSAGVLHFGSELRPGWTGGIIGAVANANTSWATCYEKAGELCGPAGYDVIQQTGEGGVYGQGGNGGGFVSTTNNRSMIVNCKGAAQGSAIAPAAPAPAMAQQKNDASAGRHASAARCGQGRPATAIRRASSRVIRLAADRRPGSSSK
jgi:hypothetical protein